MKQTTPNENQTKLGHLDFGAKFRLPGSEQVYEVLSLPKMKAFPLLGKRSCRRVGQVGFKQYAIKSNTQVIRITEVSEHSEKS